MVHYYPPNKVDLAKAALKRLLLEGPRTLPEIYAYCKATYPVRKADIKQARKDLGVISENIDGIQIWRFPEGKEVQQCESET